MLGPTTSPEPVWSVWSTIRHLSKLDPTMFIDKVYCRTHQKHVYPVPWRLPQGPRKGKGDHHRNSKDVEEPGFAWSPGHPTWNIPRNWRIDPYHWPVTVVTSNFGGVKYLSNGRDSIVIAAAFSWLIKGLIIPGAKISHYIPTTESHYGWYLNHLKSLLLMDFCRILSCKRSPVQYLRRK